MIETGFIYPSHPIFEPYRELAEAAELKVTVDVARGIGKPTCHGSQVVVEYEQVDVPYGLAFGRYGWNLKNAPEWTYETDAVRKQFWRQNGGINTLSSYKLWPKSYVNEGQRIMSTAGYFAGHTPQANEIIAHGVGTLRPVQREHKGFRSALGETAVRVDSRDVQRLGVYIVDVDTDRNGEWVSAPIALESTNLVMPEILGELAQLQARRDEADFIDAYFSDLLDTFKPVPVLSAAFEGEAAPASIAHLKPAWRIAHQNHLQTGLWSALPRDSSELLDRVDELVDRITIDTDPIEAINK
ncbi:hypothetical protein HYW35_02110 [Candidatus Saccharibacteria bacterium]|nr:hypothetical protein [Candidatus Saccharibacteria bacterium]